MRKKQEKESFEPIYLPVWNLAFQLPALKDRPEDLSPNIEESLSKQSEIYESQITMTTEAREKFLHFAQSSGTTWMKLERLQPSLSPHGNLLQKGKRIGVNEVNREIKNLQSRWNNPTDSSDEFPLSRKLLGNHFPDYDLIEIITLEGACKHMRTANRSRCRKETLSINSGKKLENEFIHRVIKLLKSFELTWEQVQEI